MSRLFRSGGLERGLLLIACSLVLLVHPLLVSGLGARMESAKVPGPKVLCGAAKMGKRPGAGVDLGLMFSSQNKRQEISFSLKWNR